MADHVSSNDRSGAALRRRLRHGGAWIVIGRTAGMATVLANYMFLARAATASDFAAFVLITSIVSFVSMIAMFGLNTLICRYLSESLGVGDGRRATRALMQTIGLGTISISLVGVLAYPTLKFFGSSLFKMTAVEDHAGLVALWIVLLAASQIIAEVFRGLHDLRMAAVLAGMSGGLIANVLFFVGTWGVSLWVPIDFYWIAVLSVLSLGIATVASAAFLALRWHSVPKGHVEQQSLRPVSLGSLSREAWSLMLVQVLSFGLAQLDIWIVGMYCSNTDLAVYGVARRLCLLVAVPLTQISLAISSSIAELHACGDQRNLQRIVRGASTVGALASGLPTIVLLLFAESALRIIFNESYEVGAQTLRLLLMGQAIFAMTGPCGPMLLMTGHQRVSLWTAVGVLPLYGLCPWAATVWGLEGIALIFSVALALQNLSQWIVVARVLGITTQPCFCPSYVRQLVRA